MVALNSAKFQAPLELTPRQKERLRSIEWQFHVRVFGEEMARVNFMPIEERKAYLERCRQRIRHKSALSKS